ncbi:hypothetical protein PSTT_15903 [Puccinia striiformis]|uniref:Man(5)GlcNAc(2)-PP-dolichol translocation protein RFT1 n=1 Tax=Puccinia striiformis TaxID=27350 RepID=A0A2S4UFE5_9BASI|nr:hypothetical protein PSTT_15903 [Puccinia striiformis]
MSHERERERIAKMSSELIGTGVSLVGLQLVSRLLTFFLNQSLLRLATPETLGTASIQFELLVNTILFFSREGIRTGLSRTQHLFIQGKSGDGRRHQQIINTSYIPIPIGIITSLLTEQTRTQTNFTRSLLIYWVSVIIELLSEPAYINLTLRGETGRRVRVEGVAVTVKTIGTISVVYLGSYWGYDAGLLGFAIGQLTYSLSLCIGFWSTLFHCSSERNLYPRQVDNSSLSIGLDSWIHAADYSLCWALTRQSIIKQFLTEGDKLIVSKICPIANQGAYALAMNYGSLVARILFQPIEETSRLYFSKNLSLPSSQSPTTTKETRESTVDHTSKEESERAKGAIDLLKNLLKAQIYLGLIFITFGPPYVRIVTRLLLGRRSGYLKEGSSSTIVEVLSAYCHLIPLLGLNGIIEGFVQSTALESDLNKLSKLMGLWCLIFIGSVSLFNSPFISTQFSISAEVAIVMATCINMICRIGYGSWYIIHYFRSKMISERSRIKEFLRRFKSRTKSD